MTQPNQPCIGVLGVSQEFDNPQRTSEDLGFTRQALAELLERAPVGVFIKNINSEFIDFNKELMRLVGETDRNEVLGSTDMKFFAEEYAEQSRQDELKIIETKQPMQFLRLTKSLKGPQLSQRFVSKMPLLDKNGNVRGILGFSHDATITFDKFGFIKKVLSAIPEAIYVVDANGRYVLVNERFARRFKGDAPEVFDSEFLTAVDMFADCAEEMARLDRAVMESRDELKVDKRYVKMKDREGSLTFFEVTRIFFTDELTRQNYVIGLLDDRSVELTSPTLQSTAATIRDEMWKRISNPDRVYWLLCLFLTHRHGLGMNRVALWEYFNAGRAANGATTAPVLVGLTGVGQLTMAEIRDVEKADPPLELIPLFECITHYDSGLGGERSSLPAFVKSKKEVQLDRDKGIGHKLRRSDRNKVSIFDMEVDEKCPFTQSVLSGMAVQRDYTMITIPCGDHTFVVTADNVRTPDGSRPRVSEDQATHLASVAIAMREIQEQVSRTKRHPKATDYREQLITHFHYCASHASGVRTFLQKSPTKDSTIQRVVDYLSADIVRFEQLLTDLCRTESAGERPEMVSVSVREVLRIVLDEYRLRGLEPVVVESGLFELLVHCSVDLVQRVATELAENVNRHGAIAKMMIEVGVDEIDGETLIRDAGKSGYVIAGARSSDKFVRIRIRDTGTGIPGRVKSRLFDGGLDESRGRRRIGLSSAMDCMLRQGGWIQEIGTTSAVFALSFRCS
jgi:PAS domain S-box-containing protein